VFSVTKSISGENGAATVSRITSYLT